MDGFAYSWPVCSLIQVGRSCYCSCQSNEEDDGGCGDLHGGRLEMM